MSSERYAMNSDLKDALNPIASSSFSSRLANNVSQVISNHASSRMLSDLAPVLMTPKMVNAATSSYARASADRPTPKASTSKALDFATIGRAPGRLTLAGRRLTARDLEIKEATSDLLTAEIPSPDSAAPDVSLLRGFNATIPSSEKSKLRRRKIRNVDTAPLGLKQMGIHARGLLSDEADDQVGILRPLTRHIKRGRESLSASVNLGRAELERQTDEIRIDTENIDIRRRLIRSELEGIDEKIAELNVLRRSLEDNLMKLHEEELELQDELDGVQERISYEDRSTQGSAAHSNSIRRHKGPAFLPSEHDELPTGVAFMTISGHRSTITALDFSEPYGLLVSSSSSSVDDGGGARVWDLCTAEEIGRLRAPEGNREVVKCLQVADNICVTGSSDAGVRIWDLNRVGTEPTHDDGVIVEAFDPSDHSRSRTPPMDDSSERSDPLTGVLHGHTQPVSTLHFEDSTLVTGASDKTIRQWDIVTGQCVLTMDILWAISHPPSSGRTPRASLGISSSLAGIFSVPTPPSSDGSWDMFEDFVGGLQFWRFALVSGSGDAAVRMWDMRTGQAHRTLLGHTGPITCLQFDENHIASGSLDKTIRIWDLRTGSITDTIRFDYPVTSLQFDSRKVIASAGDNGVKVYNRTTMQQSTLITNGHTQPCERIRYMDRYMVSGGRDACVKIWSL